MNMVYKMSFPLIGANPCLIALIQSILPQNVPALQLTMSTTDLFNIHSLFGIKVSYREGQQQMWNFMRREKWMRIKFFKALVHLVSFSCAIIRNPRVVDLKGLKSREMFPKSMWFLEMGLCCEVCCCIWHKMLYTHQRVQTFSQPFITGLLRFFFLKNINAGA